MIAHRLGACSLDDDATMIAELVRWHHQRVCGATTKAAGHRRDLERAASDGAVTSVVGDLPGQGLTNGAPSKDSDLQITNSDLAHSSCRLMTDPIVERAGPGQVARPHDDGTRPMVARRDATGQIGWERASTLGEPKTHRAGPVPGRT